MKEEVLEFRLAVNTELNGFFYANYVNIGGGSYEFVFTKSPNKYYESLQEINPIKELLERAIRYGWFYDNNNYIFIEDYFYEENGKILNVNIQKTFIIKEITTEII